MSEPIKMRCRHPMWWGDGTPAGLCGEPQAMTSTPSPGETPRAVTMAVESLEIRGALNALVGIGENQQWPDQAQKGKQGLAALSRIERELAAANEQLAAERALRERAEHWQHDFTEACRQREQAEARLKVAVGALKRIVSGDYPENPRTEARAALAASDREIAELRADAERYRQIRKANAKACAVEYNADGWVVGDLEGEDLDRVVDADIAARSADGAKRSDG